MPMTLPDALERAVQCAPEVAPQTLLSIVQVESGFEPLAIGVNGSRARRPTATSKGEAIAMASQLIASGESIDLGLAQINSKNLAWLGLTLAEAFEPCRNLAASAKVIAAGYARAAPRAGEEQAALRTALSLYNTGDFWRGFRNGYVAKVTAAAGRIVPALNAVAAGAPSTTAKEPAPRSPDVFARPARWAGGFVLTPHAPGDDH